VDWGEMGLLGSLDLAGRLGGGKGTRENFKRKGSIDAVEAKGSIYILSKTLSLDIF
jgi:hypothetical protein